MFLQTSDDIVRLHPDLERAVRFIDGVLEETSSSATLDPRQLARVSGINENQIEAALDLIAEHGSLHRIEVAECEECQVLIEFPGIEIKTQTVRCTRCDQPLSSPNVFPAYSFTCPSVSDKGILKSSLFTNRGKEMESPIVMSSEISKQEREYLMELLRTALPNKDTIENFVAECSQHKQLRGGMKYEPLNTAYRLLIDISHAAHKLGDLLFELSIRLDRNDIATAASHFVNKYQESSSHAVSKGFFELDKRALEGVTRTDAFIGSRRLVNLIEDAERRVCKVRCKKCDVGTGFLINNSLVLTCFHVVEIKDQFGNGTGRLYSPSDISVQFDFFERENGTIAPTKDYSVDTGWKIRSSIYSKADLSYPPTEPDVRELDYAILKLQDEVGKETVNGKARGYFSISSNQSLPPFNTRIVVAGHPGPETLQPLKVSMESVGFEATTANKARIIYKTSTVRGSSGSPVFDFECNVIGLHHAPGMKDPSAKDRFLNNRGINISFIAKEIADLLSVAVMQNTESAVPRVEHRSQICSSEWDVNAVPIDWSRKEPREIEQLLIGTIDVVSAIHIAQECALPVGQISRSDRPDHFWRNLLNSAAAAGKLYDLLCRIANDPAYQGIATMIRMYLP